MKRKNPQPVCRLAHAYSYRTDGGFEERPSLLLALGFSARNFPAVCALTGGGGKTTTLFRLADELVWGGKRVLVTTSTHFQCLYPEGAYLAENSGEITRESWSGPVLTVGRPLGGPHGPGGARPEAAAFTDGAGISGSPKLAMPLGLADAAETDRLLGLCDVILYEADGSRHHPAKVWRAGEPVILPRTELVITCLGLSAFGRPLRDVCFRFETEGGFLRRPDGVPPAPEDLFDADTAVQILADPRGAAGSVPPGAAYRILLNQADNSEELTHAAGLAGRLPEALRENCAATAYLRS